MCMLTFIPAGRVPDREALTNGAEWNNDGHGFAIVAGGKLIVRRSMDYGSLIEEFIRLRAKHLYGPALFHSRLSTAGTIGLDNCHPFYIGNDRQTLMAHNGIFPELAQPRFKEDVRSDTRITAESLMPAWFGPLHLQESRDFFAYWAGKFNKVVILTVNPKYDRQSYLIHEESGIWDHKSGIWYSCDDYLGYGKYRSFYVQHGTDVTTTLGYAKSCDTLIDFGVCEYCAGRVSPVLNVCLDCRTCLDCEEYVYDCDCYLPEGTSDVTKRQANDAEEYAGWWKSVTDAK